MAASRTRPRDGPMSTLVENFGVTVRQLRESQGWSQEQLAERSNLNRSYVGEIERGRVISSSSPPKSSRMRSNCRSPVCSCAASNSNSSD